MSEIKNLTVRNLKEITSGNLKGCKECNVLKVVNLDEFLENHYVHMHVDYYASPFKVLYELESLVRNENSPQETILIPYKEHGDDLRDYYFKRKKQ